MGFVLSLFPGIGLLDMAFEIEGNCVVRGPDVLWGGDVRRFHPPAGCFDGVIGGPPCQCFSDLRKLLKAKGSDVKAENLVPDFVRCVEEADLEWFLMENVKGADDPSPVGYCVRPYDVRDCDVGGETLRRRRFWFGDKLERELRIELSPRRSLFKPERAVTRNARIPTTTNHLKRKGRGGILPGDGKYMPLADVCELQGLPRTYFNDSPFLSEKIRIMLGNGVPLAMGRAVARAVREAVAV